MFASIYARFSSQNQREESISDQIASCRRAAQAMMIMFTPIMLSPGRLFAGRS